MSDVLNDDISFEYDENADIEEDEVDSILSGDSGKREQRQRNIPDITLYQLLTKKRKLIHFFFRKITIISFLATLIYNIYWIRKMKYISLEEKLINFNSYKNFILKVSYFFLIKGFSILFLPQLICGFEKGINDFTYICLFIKILTSYLMSYYITLKMKRELKIDKNFNIMERNNSLYYWTNLYYISECIYIKGIYTFLVIILSFILIKILKELWKAIKYSLK